MILGLVAQFNLHILFATGVAMDKTDVDDTLIFDSFYFCCPYSLITS